MEKGYLSLVLHAHLPFIRHPEYADFLEENWFYEAVTETYIPLINMMENLERDNVHFRLTMSLTPPLISMMRDPLLQERYVTHIEELIELSAKEIHRNQHDPVFLHLAQVYHDKFRAALHTFERDYGRDLTRAFKRFEDSGCLEIITCAATHAFLPLYEMFPQAIRAQIKVAVDLHQSVFGHPPRGIWLPECGYFPGLDNYLKDQGIRYFFLDTHGVIYSNPRPLFGVHAPVYCQSGVAAFGRDLESSKQVWSSKDGYPGDFWYRDFYRDIGFDLDFDYIKDYINPDGVRIHTGIKYYRITGKTDYKEPYNPDIAKEHAATHAGNFMFNRQEQIKHLNGVMQRKPIIVAPYDAELFGHWWFEGPMWLEFLFRKIAYDQNDIKLATPWEYVQEYPIHQVCTPSASSWGYKGYNEVWLEGSNDWIYRHIHKATSKMILLANKYYNADGVIKRALNQAAREVLLAQSSDWPFIMKTGTAVEYAINRTKLHLRRFLKFFEQIESGNIDYDWLSYVEGYDNIFPNIDFRVFSG